MPQNSPTFAFIVVFATNGMSKFLGVILSSCVPWQFILSKFKYDSHIYIRTGIVTCDKQCPWIAWYFLEKLFSFFFQKSLGSKCELTNLGVIMKFKKKIHIFRFLLNCRFSPSSKTLVIMLVMVWNPWEYSCRLIKIIWGYYLVMNWNLWY